MMRDQNELGTSCSRNLTFREFRETDEDDRRYPLRATRDCGRLKFWQCERFDYVKGGVWLQKHEKWWSRIHQYTFTTYYFYLINSTWFIVIWEKCSFAWNVKTVQRFSLLEGTASQHQISHPLRFSLLSSFEQVHPGGDRGLFAWTSSNLSLRFWGTGCTWSIEF